MNRGILPVVVALAVAFALTAGAGVAMANGYGGGDKKCKKYKYKIKHKPPGNPHNYQILYVGSKNAVTKHVQNHGDKYLGKKCVKYKNEKKGKSDR